MSDKKRVLRIRVRNGNEPKVNITMPLALAQLARLGGIADQISTRHGIDLEAILKGIEEMPDGTMIDVLDEKTGDHVEISLESRDPADATSPKATLAEAPH
jgi:hypothetical protein